MKALFITEKPSVAREFAAALNIKCKNRDGITWKEITAQYMWQCRTFEVSFMSWSRPVRLQLKKWDLGTIPFVQIHSKP